MTVPVLFDKQSGRIVSNESADIVRMLNDSFGGGLAPPALLPEIDAVNAFVYANFNNGVYRAGFAQQQQAHDDAVRDIFNPSLSI